MNQGEDDRGSLGGCAVAIWWLLALPVEVGFIAMAVQGELAWKQAVAVVAAVVWPALVFLAWRLLPRLDTRHSNPHVP